MLFCHNHRDHYEVSSDLFSRSKILAALLDLRYYFVSIVQAGSVGHLVSLAEPSKAWFKELLDIITVSNNLNSE